MTIATTTTDGSSNSEDDDDDDDTKQQYKQLKRSVRWTIVHRFGITYFIVLPFVGKLQSFMVGALIGFFIDVWIYVCRRLSDRGCWKKFLCCFLAIDLAVLSCYFFASACRYM